MYTERKKDEGLNQQNDYNSQSTRLESNSTAKTQKGNGLREQRLITQRLTFGEGGEE